MKRGPDSRSIRYPNLIPCGEVAARLGLSTASVERAWNSGIRKIGWDGIPGWILVYMVDLVSIEPRSRCASVECRKDWIERYGDF